MKNLKYTVFLLLVSCKTLKVSNMVNTALEIEYIALDTLETKYCANIEKLFIWNTKSILTSSYVDYSKNADAIEEEKQILQKLENLQKFRNLKAIYFINFCFSELPKPVMDMKSIEVLQIDYYKHFDVELEYTKISNLKKLKKLVINTFFLPKEKVQKLKELLPNLEIFSLLE